jgi:hypothetical protein
MADDSDETIELEHYSIRDLEAYIRERKAQKKNKVAKKKPPIKIEEEVKVEDLVDEIITSYTPAVKKAIYKYREKNKKVYNDYTRNYIAERMKDPEFARRKKEATAKSNEKVRQRRIAERNALQNKVKLVKCDIKPVTPQNVIIEANNGN